MKQSQSITARLCAILLTFCMAWTLSPGSVGPVHASEGGEARPEYNALPVKPKPQKTQAAKPAVQKSKTISSGAGSRTPSVRSRRPRPAPRETAPSGMPPEGETRFVDDQVVVRYRLTARQSSMDALVARLNLRHMEGRTFVLAGITAHRYQITDGSSVREVIAALEADPTVVYAQPNYLYTLLQQAGGAAGPQYALDRLAIVPAHAFATGEGIGIAVLDSQIDAAHPEFGQAKIELFDATGEQTVGAHEHGTSIAGVIASRGTLLGIAPDVQLLGIRAFLDDGDGPAFGTTWRIATGLDQAHAAAARVVNMSFAGAKDPLVGNGVAGLVRRGMVAVAAAGNDGPEARPLYPAAYPGVIAVTAVDKADLVYARANQGAYVALAAPGVDILVPVPSNGYQVTSGTSLAAAHVSGLVGLILSRDPSLTAAKVADILLSSSADLGDPGHDPVFGAGLPDALTAIKASADAK